MRLLIITQTVDKNDSVLGFFHAWLAEFAKQCEQVTVLCLTEGAHDLPKNVRVLSMGKEASPSPCPRGRCTQGGGGGSNPPLYKGRVGEGLTSGNERNPSPVTGGRQGGGRVFNLPPTTYHLLTRARYLFRFYSYLWRERKNFDAVFVHMNPEYVVFGAPLWRILGKRVSLWYTHKSVTWWLRVATHFAHTIFTASKESFRIASPKVHVVGHGIDVTAFSNVLRVKDEGLRIKDGSAIRLVSVGRVSKTKRQDLAIETLALLREKGIPAILTLIGVPLTDADRAYEKELHELVRNHELTECVIWAGSVANSDLPKHLAHADIMLHTSETGSLDKVVLEAMAAGVLPVTTSDAVACVLPKELATLCKSDATPDALALRITALQGCPGLMGLRTIARDDVVTKHALPTLVARMVHVMNI